MARGGTFTLSLLYALCSVVLSAAAKKDLCAPFVKTKETTFSPDAVRRCFGQIPYNADVAASMVDSLKKALAFMPSVDVALNSPTKELPLKVDIRKTLTDIGKKQYKSDLEFNNALSAAFDSLRDQNVAYTPFCYPFTSEIAFPLVLFWKDGQPVVQIRPSYSSPSVYNKTSLKLKKDLSLFESAAVETIEGVPAYDYLLSFANTTQGGFKDVNARLNSLFVRPTNLFLEYYTDEYPFYSGGFSSRPYLVDNATISMQIRRVGQSKSEKLTAPWYTTFLSGRFFDDITSYYKYNCMNSQPYGGDYDSPKSLSERKSVFHDSPRQPRADPMAATQKLPVTAKSKSMTGAEQLVDGVVSAWLLPDNKTGVLAIPDFGQRTFFDEWYPSLVLSLVTLKRAANQIIIDVADASGGYSSRVDALIQFLFPSLTFTAYPSEFRATRLAKLLVEAALNGNETYTIYDYRSFTDLNGLPLTNDTFFFPVVSKTFNGKKADYSKQLTVFDKSYIFQPSYLNPLFKAEDILILTNGLCYEKCAEFIFKAQEFASVKSVAVGGIPQKPMAVGGGVISSSYYLYSLLSDLSSYDLLTDKDAPPPLPVFASFTFPILQSYCKASSAIPADFVFKAANYRFDHAAETVLDRPATWAKAAQFFA